MKFSDIIALAKSGYTVSDIKELMVLSDDKPDEPDKPDKPDKPDESDKPDKPDKPNEQDKPDKPDEPDDIKSKLDAALKEIEKLKSDLDKAQKFNSKKDLKDPETKTNDDIVMEAFRNLI